MFIIFPWLFHPFPMANLELAVHGDQPQLIAVQKATKKAKKEVDDLRRDEWNSDAINCLLDVYEEKWNLRNRGNLKGGDWEDVAISVTALVGGGAKIAKTPFQCKNKVASMKQKYRSEALLRGIIGSGPSKWPFFTRMDLMLRASSKEMEDGILGDGMGAMQIAVTDLRFNEAVPQIESGDSEQEVARKEQDGVFHATFQQEKPEPPAINGDSNQGDASNTLPHRKMSGSGQSDTSCPRSKTTLNHANKHRRHFSREMATSICQFAHSILKLEEAKMEMLRNSERMRVDLEARRVDMELKRTEIIMNTQLEIAKLLSFNRRKKKAKKSVQVAMSRCPTDSSLLPTVQNSMMIHPNLQGSLSTDVTDSIHQILSENVMPSPALVQSLHCRVQINQT